MRRNRQDDVVPKTHRDIVFDETSTESIVFKSDDNAIIVFTSDELIVAASSTKFVCVDGTFGRCPRTHYQLLTCHSVCHDGFSFPFAFALLPNKKATSYQTVFNEIDMKALSLCNRPVFSRGDLVVSCDFEKGILKALDTLECSVKCCLFHMNQAILRFVQKKGMAKRYVTDSKFRSSVRSLMVLPLFPADAIARVYENMDSMFPRDDIDLSRVYFYFGDVWIQSIPITCWCQYDTNFRTNNFAESFHVALSRTGMQQHPEFNTFWHAVRTLIEEGQTRLQSPRLNPKSKTTR